MEALQPFYWCSVFEVPYLHLDCAIGGGTGWAIGATVGAGVGAMGGGAAASKLYARRQNAKQM